MRKILFRAAALAAAACVAAPAAAAPTRFDPAQARSPAETLVLCDIASFLKSDPDLDSWTIYVRHERSDRFEPLFGPDFLTGGRWYDEDYESAYRRLRRQNKVTFQEVLDAQRRFGGQISELKRLQVAEVQAYRAQDRACQATVKAL